MPKSSLLATSLILATVLGEISVQAQVTAWTNTAGGNWNTAANWNPNIVPDAGTNTLVTNAATYAITYNAPMTATAIGTLTNGTSAILTLNISAGGFNVAGTTFLNGGSGSALNLITNGVMTNATVSVQNQNAAINFNGGSMTNGTSQLSNNGSNDGGPVRVTNGIANLGTVTIGRSGATVFNNGVTVLNPGTLVANSITLGNRNSFATMAVGGGTVAVSGPIMIAFGTAASRQCQLLVTNGTVNVGNDVSLAGAVNQIAWLNVTNAGVLNANGIVLFTNPISGAVANITNAGTIYLGSDGLLLTNAAGNTYNISLQDQGLLGASADWIGSADALLRSGVFTFKAADSGGAPHNITFNGGLRGSGALNKTGGGMLILNATNVNSGSTLVNAGSLVIGATGTLSNSTSVIVGNGTILDVSAVSGGFVLNVGQTLAGSGVVTGTVTAASGAIINPGSNALTGTLNFSNSVTEAGGVTNHFDLSTNPSGPNNDFEIIAGDLNVSGLNTVEISGGGPAGSIHPLINYAGAFNGDVSNNFTLAGGATGYLSNNVTAKTIYFVVATTVRGPTNIKWVGNSVINDWDTQNRTNWSNAGVLDFFVPGDTVLFDDVGGVNPMVNLVGSLSPSSVTVNSTSNYVFTGNGFIGSALSLLKTNSGILTIVTSNTYTGPTIISGGAIEASNVSPSGVASAIGAATADPANLVLASGILRYIGPSSSTDRGVTINSSGGTIDVPTNGTVLTITGTTAGSGTITKAGAGELNLNAINTHGGGIVVNAGTLTLANANAAGGGGITNNDLTTLKVAGAISVPNVINVNGTVTVDLNNTGGNTALDGAWSGSATVNFTNQGSGRILTMGGNGNGGANMINFSGTIAAGNCPGQFRFNDGGGNPNTGSTNMTLDLGSNTAQFLVRNGGVTINIGALLGGTGTSVSGRGNGSSGTVTYSIGGKNTDTLFEGRFVDGGNATAVTKVGTGTLSLDSSSSHTGATVVSNGVLALVSSGSIDNSSIRITSQGVLDVSSRTDSTLNLGLNALQTLSGNGILRGSLAVGGSGTVSPGASIGTLTVTNAITYSSGATTLMELNRAATPNADKLVGGSITFGGTLIVTNLGAPLQPGDSFDLFDGPLSGSFNLVILPNYYSWNTNDLAVDGTITVTGVLPGPTISSVEASGSSLSISVTNGAPNGPLTVLTSSDLLAPISSWTVLTTGQFDGSGNYSFQDGIDPTIPQKFYMLQVR
jgi:autotransporter-associated beta strand protein